MKTIRLPPGHNAVVDAKLSASVSTDGPLLLEDCTLGTGSVVGGSLLRTTETGLAQLVISNTSGWTEMIQEGQELGVATGVSVINPRLERDGRANQHEQLRASPNAEHFAVEDSGIVRMLNGGADQRKRRLSSLIDCGCADLSSEEAARLTIHYSLASSKMCSYEATKPKLFPAFKIGHSCWSQGPGTTLQLHTDIQHNTGCNGGEIN